MQKISVGLARSVWLFDINELNPAGKSIFPDVLIWLGEKYSFQSFPKSIAEIDPEKKGYLFKTGQFQTDDEEITVNFSIYSDGLIAETWNSTEKGDLLLDEILHSGAARYGLPIPTTIRKQYVSELTVQSNYPLNNIVNPKVVAFCDTINKLFACHNLPPFEVTGIGFGLDSSSTSYKPPGLVIERKLGVPFRENRFWSKSPFATKDHLYILEEFEKLMAGSESTNPAMRPEINRAISLED